MYLIVNKSKNTITQAGPDFPNCDADLDWGNKIIIISLYSNTIKVPYLAGDEYGKNIWEWDEYVLPIVTIVQTIIDEIKHKHS